MKMITSLLILGLTLSTFAQESIDPNFDSTKEVSELVKGLENLSASDYTLKIEEVRDKLEKYIENKKRVCDGDFSTVVLSRGERESDKKKSVKLSIEEREVCFRELKQVQQKYIESLFGAKKRYLVHLHQQRMNELEVAKEMAIKELNQTFNKKGRR